MLLCQAANCTSTPEPPSRAELESPAAIELGALAQGRETAPDIGARLERLLGQARGSPRPGDMLEPLLGLAWLARGKRDLETAERHLAAARLAVDATTPARLRGWLDCLAAALALDRNRSEEAAGLAERARLEFGGISEASGEVQAATLLITARGMHQARFEEAYGLVDECLRAADADELLRLRCVNSRAALAYNLADYETAVVDFAEIAAPASEMPAKLKATARLNLALCHVHLGQYGAARLAIEDALAAARVPGRTEYPEAVPLYYRGYLLSRLGDHAGAFEDYIAALALFRRDGNLYFESFLLVDIGDNLLRRGQPQRAIDEYENSLEIYRAAENPRGVMLVEEGIGRALLDLGQDEVAERRLRRALAISTELGDDHGWARIAAVLGDRRLRSSAPAEAERLLGRAVEVAAAKGLVEEEFRAMLALSRTRRDLGRREAALASYRATLDVLERIRDQLNSESQHLTFAESRNVAYRETVDLLLRGSPQAQDIAEAFAVAERARARALLEVMQQARLAGATRSPTRQRERLAILVRLSRAQTQVLTAADDDAAANNALRRAREELERFDLEESSSLPAAAHPRPRELPEVLRHVGAGRTLAVFWISAESSYLWSLREDRTSFVKLAPYDEITAAAEAYREAISHEPGLANPAWAWREPARALAEVLRIDQLLGAEQDAALLVVPDGPLHGLPLEPLITRARNERGELLLGDLFELVYLPSASFLTFDSPRREHDRAVRLFALGDPVSPSTVAPLPGSREEVQRIARLFDDGRAVVRLGARATKGALQLPEAATADILHIAARTVSPEQQPGMTGIALAPDEPGDDGLLRPHEIASLVLVARLTVLSACGTGLGQPVVGEGLHGLARAFLIAGVPAIVPSQWDVSDHATAELMEHFYRGLSAGDPAHRALAGATRRLRRDSLPLYAHPYYWAPFTLFGSTPPVE